MGSSNEQDKISELVEQTIKWIKKQMIIQNIWVNFPNTEILCIYMTGSYQSP